MLLPHVNRTLIETLLNPVWKLGSNTSDDEIEHPRLSLVSVVDRLPLDHMCSSSQSLVPCYVQLGWPSTNVLTILSSIIVKYIGYKFIVVIQMY